MFQVKGQLAWTIPPLATDSSLFALTSKVDPAADPEYTSLHGKIALVRRGEIPLVYKILNLQVSPPSLPPFPLLPLLIVPHSVTVLSPASCWTLRTVRNLIKLVCQDHKK